MIYQPGYKENFITEQSNQTSEITREALLFLKPKIEKIGNKPRIPLVMKFNRVLPNIREIIDKHWDLLHINPKLKNAFQERPKIAYKKNRNFKEIIESNKILKNKLIQKKKRKEVPSL